MTHVEKLSRTIVGLLALVICAVSFSSCRKYPDQRVENLRVFSALYGYVKYFHPSDESAGLDWDTFLVHGVERVYQIQSPDSLLVELTELFNPVAPSLQLAVGKLPNNVPSGLKSVADSILFKVAWNHSGSYVSSRAGRDSLVTLFRVDGWCCEETPDVGEVYEVDLGQNIWARIPLALWADSSRTYPEGNSDELTRTLQAVPIDEDVNERFLGLAAAIKFWNLQEHFFPYFDVAGVDWDQELNNVLLRGLQASSSDDVRDNLNLMTASLNDGHAAVWSSAPRSSPSPAAHTMPLRFDWVQDQLVVVLSDTNIVEVGDVVEKLGGHDVEEWYAQESSLVSGSEVLKRKKMAYAASNISPLNEDGEKIGGSDSISVVLRRSDKLRYEVRLRRDGRRYLPRVYLQRSSEPIRSVEDGIYYIDLDRAKWSDLEPSLEKIAGADGVIFDLRGFPGNSGSKILSHLISRPDTVKWMFVPVVTRPHMRDVWWMPMGWNIEPATPHIEGKVVFLTNSWAQSYAESVMGYVDGYHLGTIVGSPTTGVNGAMDMKSIGKWNVASTGTRVLRHNGDQLYRLGIQPDIRAVPTIEGIRSGVDEVLEKGLEILRGKINSLDRD